MKNKKQKGIALITTIILSSIMLTTVFVVSREMLEEAKNSTQIDNSLIAYYAAEAGLEDALLEWRFDHEKEITKTCKNIKTSKTVTCGDSKNFNDSYYELDMTNKVDGGLKNIPIKKDDIYELKIPNGIGSVDINWETKEVGVGKMLLVEVAVYDENGNITKNLNLNGATSYNIPGTGKRTVRVKPWYTTSDGKSGADMSTGSPTPYILLSVANQNVGGSITYIDSIGYYGGVARKIKAEIDRDSGNILNIFDYALYSGSDLVK